MSRIKHLQLVLPQALAELRTSDANAQDSPLWRWLAHGDRQRLWQPDDLQHARLDPWQHSLLYAFNAALRAQGLASAMLHWRGEGGDQERGLAEKYRQWGQALQVSHPFVAAKLLMALAQTYDHMASREDTEASIRRRMS